MHFLADIAPLQNAKKDRCIVKYRYVNPDIFSENKNSFDLLLYLLSSVYTYGIRKLLFGIRQFFVHLKQA